MKQSTPQLHLPAISQRCNCEREMTEWNFLKKRSTPEIHPKEFKDLRPVMGIRTSTV